MFLSQLQIDPHYRLTVKQGEILSYFISGGFTDALSHSYFSTF